MTEPTRPARVLKPEEIIDKSKHLKVNFLNVQKPESVESQTYIQEHVSDNKPKPLRRSDSLIGLSSLAKGVNEMETMLASNQQALNHAFSLLQKQNAQIDEQEKIIKEYHDKLEEFDLLFDKIILN